MAIDLMKCEIVGDTEETFGYKTLPAFDLVAYLCMEARVCIHDPETNPIEIHAATWDVHNGLLVTDEHGKTFRLRVTAEEIK